MAKDLPMLELIPKQPRVPFSPEKPKVKPVGSFFRRSFSRLFGETLDEYAKAVLHRLHRRGYIDRSVSMVAGEREEDVALYLAAYRDQLARGLANGVSPQDMADAISRDARAKIIREERRKAERLHVGDRVETSGSDRVWTVERIVSRTNTFQNVLLRNDEGWHTWASASDLRPAVLGYRSR